MALKDALDYLNKTSGSSESVKAPTTSTKSSNKNLGSALDYLNSAQKPIPTPTASEPQISPVDALVSQTVNDTSKTIEQAFQPKLDEITTLKNQIESSEKELNNYTFNSQDDVDLYNQKVAKFNSDLDRYNSEIDVLNQAFPEAAKKRAEEVQFQSPDGVLKKYSWGVGETLSGVWRGIGNMVGAAGQGLDYLGAYGVKKSKDMAVNFGKDPKKEDGGLWKYYSVVGEKLANAGEVTTKEFQTEFSEDFEQAFQLDPINATKKHPFGFFLKATEQVPLTLALMVPGIGAGAAAGGTGAVASITSPFWRLAAQSMVGATVMRPLEGLMEAGQTYEEAKTKGFTEDEAVKAGGEVFADNLKLAGLDAAQLLAITPAFKMLAGANSTWAKIGVEAIEMVGAGLTEGGEEVYQLYAQKKALGEDFDMFGSESIQSFMLGAVSGMVFQAAGSVMTKDDQAKMLEEYQEELASRLPEETKKEFKRAVEEAVKEADTPEAQVEARKEVLDQFAETNPDEMGQAIEALDQEAQEAFTESRTAVEEEALAEYNTGTEPEVDVNAVFEEVQAAAEPNPVEELKAGQDAILAALDEGAEGKPQKKEDLKAQTDEQVEKTKPVEVEKAKKEDTEPVAIGQKYTITEELTDEKGKTSTRTDNIVVRGIIAGRVNYGIYKGNELIGKGSTPIESFRANAVKQEVSVDDLVTETLDTVKNKEQNKQNGQDTNTRDGVGQGSDTKGRRDDTSGQGTRRKGDTSDSKSVLGGERSRSDTRTGERPEQTLKEALSKDEKLTGAFDNKTNSKTGLKSLFEDRFEAVALDLFDTTGNTDFASISFETRDEMFEEMWTELRETVDEAAKKIDTGGEPPAPPAAPQLAKNKDVPIQAVVRSSKEPTAENEIPVKAEMAKAYHQYYSSVLEALGDTWVVDDSYKTNTGKISLKKMFNPGGVGVEGDATVIFWKGDTKQGIYLSGSGTFDGSSKIKIGKYGLGLLYRTTTESNKYTGNENNYIDPTKTSPTEFATKIENLYTADFGVSQGAKKPEYKQQTTRMGRVIQTIVENNGHNLNEPEFSITLNVEGYMPLHIEKIGEYDIAMSHTFEQNGDIVRDPEIVFGINEKTGKLEAKTIEHPPMVVMGKELVGARPIRPNDPFITMWADNLKAKGFLDAKGEAPDVALTETQNVIEARNNEADVVERLQKGESVKATDLASAMGIEVVNITAEEITEEEQEIADENKETMEEVLKKLTTIDENGDVQLLERPTREQQEALEEFEPAGGKEKQGAEGRGLLDEYYTPEEIVEVLSTMTEKYQPTAYTNGNNKLLEPAGGIGNLLTAAPPMSDVTLHEINQTAARIAKVTNFNAGYNGPTNGINVSTKPFEEMFIDSRGNKKEFKPDYETVIMNPPYGEHRGVYKGLGEEPNIKRYEDYFMKRGMDVLVPEGKMYAIVPSLFVRGGSNTAKKGIARQGELVEVIRFPNGAFSTTDIGVDLLVFRKDEAGYTPSEDEVQIRVNNMSNDVYLQTYPSHILGTEGTRSGRFGEETYVSGTLSDALKMFEDLDIVYKPSRTDIAIKEKYAAADKAKAEKQKKADKPDEKKIEQREKTKTTPKKQKSKFDDPKKPKKAPPVPKVAVYETDKVTPEKDLLDMSQFSTATEEEKALWNKVTATGELDIEVDINKAIPTSINYMDGKWYNDFNYLQGNITEKLEQLERDYKEHHNDNLPEINYRSQKEKLEAIRPELHPIERMKLSPNSDFVRELIVRKDGEMGQETPLSELFYDWLRTLPHEAFGDSSLWAIRGYINNNAVRGNDKIKNETERRTRRTEGNRLFKLFITENLSDRNKKTLLEAYNKKFNSVVNPPYSKVPLMAKIHPTFIDGKPLIIKPVQLEGVSFIVNKGTGILGWDVGVGKTLGAIIANAELLQRGWAKKPLIVVPSISVYNQWFKEIREVIPNVKINLLANLGGDFHGDINNLKIEEGTLTLMTVEGFKKLGFTEETYNKLTQDLVDVVDKKKAGITKRQEELDKSKQEEFVGKGIRGTKENISFEDLGFDYITYDELQNANHVFGSAKVEGGSTEFRGMTQTPSVEGIKLWLASQYVQSINNGRGMIGLSATPFRNSVLEYFSVMSMVARERMKGMGVFNVNDFMTMFMDISTRPEFKADGQYQDKTDVRSFINYEQFGKLLSEFIDFKQDNTERPNRHQREHIIPETATQIEYRNKAQELFADTKNGGVLKGIKEMKMTAISPYLSIYNKNRTPTLEEFVENSPKIKLLAKMIAKNLKDNPDGNQVVYSPLGTNVFGYIKDAIVKEAGLKPDQVQIIAGKAANPTLDIPMKWNVNKSNRTKIQEDFNDGKVKVIIGSETIEEGINLQRRSTDLFVLSEPWNFTALRQVTGRIWRPKNTWRNVRINHMLTENSIDIFLLQKLETKGARFDATTEFKGDEKETGEIDPGSLKWDLLTDPVQNTKMKYEELQATLNKEKKTLESDLAYDARKVERYMNARNAVFKTQQSMKEHPDWDWLEGNLKRQTATLEAVLADYKERNIDLTTIDEKIAKTQAEIEKINNRIENLDKEQEQAFKEAEKLRVESGYGTVKSLDLDQRLKELEEDNLDLFLGGDAHFKIVHDKDGNAQTWGIQSKVNGRYIGSMSLKDIRTVNADFIRPNEENLDEAIADVKAGIKSPSALPILVEKLSDGTYLIIDGHHRYVEEVMFGGQDAMFVTTNKKAYERMAEIEERVNELRDKPMYKITPGKMYHATLETFTAFEDKRTGINTGWDNAQWGHFFLEDKDRAITFAEDTRKPGDKREVQVKEQYLEMNKTLDLTTQGIFTIAEQAPLLVEMTGGEKGLKPEEALNLLNEEIGLGEYGDFMEAIYADTNNKKLAQKYGYDSVVSEFGTDNGQIIKEYVVFSSDQIKNTPVFQEGFVGERIPEDVVKIAQEAQTLDEFEVAMEKAGKETIPNDWFAANSPAYGVKGYMGKLSTQEEQMAYAEQAFAKLNLGVSVRDAAVIITELGGKAYGVYTGDANVTIAEEPTATTAIHEVMHAIFDNMHKMDAFKNDFTRGDILRALNGGRDWTSKDIPRLNEALSVAYEKFRNNVPQKLPTIVQKFFLRVKMFLDQFRSGYNRNTAELQKFFYQAYAVTPTNFTPGRVTENADVGSLYKTESGDVVLDFDYTNKKRLVDEMHKALFKEVFETLLPEEEITSERKEASTKYVNWFEKQVDQLNDIYLKDPEEFAQAKLIEKIDQVRTQSKRTLDNKFAGFLSPYFELKGTQRTKVDRVLMQGDRDMVEYEEYQLKDLGLNGEEIKAYKDVRKAFRGAHAILLMKMEQLGIDKAEIDTFRAERDGYMPHTWKHEFFVEERHYNIETDKWNLVSQSSYKTRRKAKQIADEMNAKNGNPNIEFRYQPKENLEQDFFIQEGVDFEKVKGIINQSAVDGDTKLEVVDKIRNLFKSKGFGSHYIKRWGIEGYQEENMAEIIADYFSGFSGYVTKMEAAPQYYEVLNTINPKEQKGFREYVLEHIQYQMGGEDYTFRGVRTAAFAYFLANDISYLAANATQNYVIGAGELSKYQKGTDKLTAEARIIKAVKDWAVGNVTAEERETVEGLLAVNELGGQMASELLGFKNNPLYRGINSAFSTILYKTTEIVEVNVNRVPMFLAARRLFIEQGMSEKEANERALQVSNDVHFLYGKQHRPAILRGNKNVLFIFLHYMMRFLHLMYLNMRAGEYLAVARTMTWTVALGGVTSLPMAKLFVLLFGMVFKDFDDDEGKEAMESWELIIKKGAPAYMGVDMSGRVGVEILALNMILEKPNDVSSYLGAAGGLATRAFQGVDALSQGREVDAAAKLLPDMIANPIKAYQGWRIGVRSNAGVPLEDFDGDLYKYNTLEAIIKATGFTPTRESLLWDARAKEWDVADNVSTARGRVRGEIRYLVQTGDFATAREVQEEAIAKGIMKEDMDYVKEFGKDIFIMEAYESVQSTGDVKAAETRLINQVYPNGASDQQKNNLRKDLAIFRVYGTDNKLANDIAGSQTNDDKLQLLLDARETMGAEAVADFIKLGRKEIRLESGRTSEILISDDLLKRYKEAIAQ